MLDFTYIATKLSESEAYASSRGESSFSLEFSAENGFEKCDGRQPHARRVTAPDTKSLNAESSCPPFAVRHGECPWL
jgi:hypothetical protein